MRTSRIVVGGVGTAVLTLLAAGCADGSPAGSAPSTGATSSAPTPEPPLPSPTRGLPDGATPVEGGLPDATAGVGWSAEAGRLDVVTYGSSTCPVTGESPARWDDAHEAVVVALAEPDPGAMCTTDLAPTTSVVAVPADVDENASVSVRLDGDGEGDGDGEVEVAPRPEAGAAGPIAWLER